MVKISALPPASSVADADESPIVQGGVTKKAARSVEKDYFLGGDVENGFVEIGRATLGTAADTLSVTGLPTFRYLQILIGVEATGGTLDALIRFNNDSGANYYVEYIATLDGVTTTQPSTTSIPTESGATDSGQQSAIMLDIMGNRAAEEKLFRYESHSLDAIGAATRPAWLKGQGKWANTSVVIDRIDIINNGTGDFAIGSEIIVLGKN